MEKLRSFFIKSGYPILIILLGSVLFGANYQDGQFILGWDNFNSELNPQLAVSQAISAGWSDFRSFGLVAGMGYATDFIHAIIVWIAHFFIPITAIRFTFHIAMLTTGALGVYALLSTLGIWSLASFIGSLYYMFNFGTLQLFGLPYEPFSIFFGFLPWVINAWFHAISQWNRRSLLLFLLANVLLTGAFYVQTQFAVYTLVLGGINIVYAVLNRSQFRSIVTRSLLLWISIVAVNSYWLLTQLYFLTNAVATVQQAKQTLLGWRVPYFQNKAHGGLVDFFTQTGYYSDFVGKGGLAFSAWHTYFRLWPIRIVQFLGVGTILLGILEGRNKFKPYFILILIMASVALLLDVPIISDINAWFRQNTFFDQIFRSPFSKIAVVQSLAFSYFISLGYMHLHDIFRYANMRFALFATGIAMILLIALPSFQGYFFSPTVRVTLPQQYNQLFRFFQTQNEHKRIGLLPEMNVWGWYEYSWGYVGSGFLWHGIRQPIVSRSYDPWSKTSENYFWELTTALNSEDPRSVNAVLQKYAISYLIIDDSLVLNPKSTYKMDKIKIMIGSIPGISRVLKLATIDVYELRQPTPLLSSTALLPNIGPPAHFQNTDNAYSKSGMYITSPNRIYDHYYPFTDLQTLNYDPYRRWNIEEHNDFFVVTTSVPDNIQSTPESTASAIIEPITMVIDKGSQTIAMPITLSKRGAILTVTFPKIAITRTNTSSIKDCTATLQLLPNRSITFSSLLDGMSVESAEGPTACWGYHYDQALQRQAYLIKNTATTLSGLPVTVTVIDHTNQQLLAQQQLTDTTDPFLIVPPGPEDGIGFSINYQNFSFVHSRSNNIVQQPIVYIFPEAILKNISYGSAGIPKQSINQIIYKKKIGSWYYLFDVLSKTNETNIVFSQSFDPGWKAYVVNVKCQMSRRRQSGYGASATNVKCSRTEEFIEKIQQTLPFLFGTEIKDHVLANNWANAWLIKSDQSDQFTNPTNEIVIFFLPQLLQWIGFFLFLLPFFFLFTRPKL